MSEKDLGKKIVEYLDVMGWDVYQEVQQVGGRSAPIADIVGRMDGRIWVIECKKNLSMGVLAWTTEDEDLDIQEEKDETQDSGRYHGYRAMRNLQPRDRHRPRR